MRFPSGETATLVTPEEVGMVRTVFHVLVSQTRTVLSSEPDTILDPSGAQAKAWISNHGTSFTPS